MERVLVLWQKDGEVYRAYAPKYPQCAAEGSSPEEVGEKMTTILRRHLADQPNGNGAPFEIILGEDKRPKDLPMDEWNLLCEEMIPELDPAMLDVVEELNRRVTPGMTQEEILAHLNAIFIEEEQCGRKWYATSEEFCAEYDRISREEQTRLEGQK